MRPHRSRFPFATVAVLAMTASMLAGTNIASADQVQLQSYQRASQTATCDSPPEYLSQWHGSWANSSDPISGPTWHPSWERWANNGTGGWTCTRTITWARGESSTRTYALGDIGPGGGLVFLISGGLTYEMAPKNWNDPTNPSATDPSLSWCDNQTTDVSGASGTAVGSGAANTAAMAASSACSSNAAAAVLAYAPAGTTAGQWFLPSKDELNAMCNYWVNPTTPPTGACTGAVSTGDYGFASAIYWSSSQFRADISWAQRFNDGNLYNPFKDDAANQRVRPIRAF